MEFWRLSLSLYKLHVLTNHYHQSATMMKFSVVFIILHFRISLPDFYTLRTSELAAFIALANEDTLLRTHCCRHKCFPVCPRAQHLLRTHFVSGTPKIVSDFVQKYFVSTTNDSQFAQHGNTTFILCPARLRVQETS